MPHPNSTRSWVAKPNPHAKKVHSLSYVWSIKPRYVWSCPTKLQNLWCHLFCTTNHCPGPVMPMPSSQLVDVLPGLSPASPGLSKQQLLCKWQCQGKLPAHSILCLQPWNCLQPCPCRRKVYGMAGQVKRSPATESLNSRDVDIPASEQHQTTSDLASFPWCCWFRPSPFLCVHIAQIHPRASHRPCPWQFASASSCTPLPIAPNLAEELSCGAGDGICICQSYWTSISIIKGTAIRKLETKATESRTDTFPCETILYHTMSAARLLRFFGSLLFRLRVLAAPRARTTSRRRHLCERWRMDCTVI